MEKRTAEGIQFSIVACVVLYLCKSGRRSASVANVSAPFAIDYAQSFF
jgi:hypothetical protein